MPDGSDTDTVLLDLLLEWDELRTAGDPATPEELCRNHPERLELLRRSIIRIGRIDQLLTLAAGPRQTEVPVVPGFELLEEIGRGGMGVVYSAYDRTLDRIVAVKVPQVGMGMGVTQERCEREAKTLARLRHPGIISVYAAGLMKDGPYFVMDYVTGGSLAEQKQRLLTRPVETAALLEQVARAVDHAHRCKVIHCDLKPSNILLDGDGHPLVSDFGVAALLTGQIWDNRSELLRDPDPSRPRSTRTHRQAGTPAYAAPELLAGNPGAASPASDVWSLGVIAYELLVGRLPFGSVPGSDGAAGSGWNAASPSAIRGNFDRGLTRIVLKCLAEDPKQRYTSAYQLATTLNRWLWQYRLWRRVRRIGLWVVVGLLGLVFLVYMAWPPPPEASYAAKVLEIREQLRREIPVELIAATGRPIAHRIRFGEADSVRTFINPDQTFGVDSGPDRPALVELLDDTGVERFRYSVEIREDAFTDDAWVGLYYAHQIVPRPEGPVHVFGRLGLLHLGASDRGIVALNHCFMLPPGTLAESWHYFSSNNKQYRPDENHWRRLSVVVSEAVVEASFDENRVESKLGSYKLHDAAFWSRAMSKTVPGLRGTGVNMISRGGVGLVLYSSKASFRNVQIEPIPLPIIKR